MNASALPPIIVSTRDAARLEQVLAHPDLHDVESAARLADEISRATLLAPEAMPTDVVTMDSRVVCIEAVSGTRHELTLSWPAEADAAQGRVSVLAPIGSALLGLRVGQSIRWPGPAGRDLQVQVTEVTFRPEADGDPIR